MSLPEFPAIDPCLTREQAVNMILVSISMEETALGRLIEVESEKIKYALDCFEKRNCCSELDRVLEVNESASRLMETVMDIQLILKKKMERALEASPRSCATCSTCSCSSARQARRRCAAFSVIPTALRGGGLLRFCKRQPACSPCAIPLSGNTKILLPSGGRFAVSFNFDFLRLAESAEPLAVELLLTHSAETLVCKRFHSCGSGVSAAVSGSMTLDTPCGASQSRLSFRLISPCGAQSEGGSVSAAEV